MEEGSYGFPGKGRGNDIDLDGIDAEADDANPDDSQPSHNTDDEEEARWTDQLIDIQVPEFLAATGINLVLNDPIELDFFLAFVGDDLWDLMVEETNRYACQKLADSPDRLTSFCPVTRAELKAFIAMNIIMGMVKLPI